ncbi:hypothetical protein M426DRAFT_17146 [Hypoxylon sp. CI-4A]|nr:hypothetical protein M426DRAFT_17146 [Hypoxylon sp. CI-4A]
MAHMLRGYKNEAELLKESGRDLLESGNFSDVTVSCGNRTWKLHRAVICVRCPYFNTVFSGSSKEATTSRFTLKDQIPEDVDGVIRYLYTGEITKEFAAQGPVELARAAELFQLRGLMNKAVEIAGNIFQKLRDSHRNPYEAPCGDIDVFFHAAKIAYNSDSTFYAPLRERVVQFAMNTQYLAIKEKRFLGLLDEIPEMAVDLLKMTWR